MSRGVHSLADKRRKTHNTQTTDTPRFGNDSLISTCDDEAVVGKTKKAMESLRRGFHRVTLDQIASCSGLPPDQIKNAAYALAPKLDLLIGRDAIVAP